MAIQLRRTVLDYSVTCTPGTISAILASGTYTTAAAPLGTFTLTVVGGVAPSVYSWTRLSGSFASVSSGNATNVLTLSDSSGQLRSVADGSYANELWRCTVHDKFSAYSVTIDVTLSILFSNA